MYSWIKALHLIAIIFFVSGMINLILISLQLRKGKLQTENEMISSVLLWNRTIAGPALIGVWLFGFWLAMDGGWLGDPWLHVKLVLALFVSALHGILSGQLRRQNAMDEHAIFKTGISIDLGFFVGLISIVLLVVIKPF